MLRPAWLWPLSIACAAVAAVASPQDSPGPASAAGAPAPAGTAATPPPARCLTRHGEVIVGQPGFRKVKVLTRYGLLEVPVEEVGRLEFARHVTEQERERARSAVEAFCQAKAGDAREQAGETVAAAGGLALPWLERAARQRSSEEDQDLREAIGELVEQLEASGARRRLPVDRVIAKKFSFVGKILLDEIALELSYGNVRLERGDVSQLAFRQGFGRGGSDRVLIMKSWSDPDQEYKNTYECIKKRTRLRLVEFTGTTASALRKALRHHSVLVIPELEKADGTMEQAARGASKAIKAFVREGGVIISLGSSSNCKFLSASGVLRCSSSSGSSDATVRRRHPITRGVSGSIPSANATVPITVQAPKMRALATAQNGSIIVGVATIGQGAVVYCGWDFFQSAEPHQKILANAVKWAAGGIESTWP